MQAKHPLLFMAVIALTVTGIVPAAQAKRGYHKIYRTAVTVYPRDRFGRDNGFGSGPGGYPAHIVPLAAYPAPTGLGITFAPYSAGTARAS